jgi:Ca-activated chloride channel homolog
LSRDLVIEYHASRPHTGLEMVTSKSTGEDGYFYLTLTAGEELPQKDVPMDYVFVQDISGSMGDDGKLDAARKSLEAFIDILGPEDRFEVTTFNVQSNALFKELRPAEEANRKAAVDFLKSQQARGGTVLQPALTTAYKYAQEGRPLNVVILSDGLTEQQERATLMALIRSRPANVRVFCIGVGNDVNRALLEQMANDAGGLAAFLSRDDNLVRAAAAFRRKLIRPAASNLKIEIAGAEVYDQEPAVLPNLYHGMPVRVFGRYRNPGEAQATVMAKVGEQELRQTVPLTFPKADGGNPEIERMWAWHKIDRLLKEADGAGSRTDVLSEIVRLGEAYSIVTEYTSFIVLENDAEYKRWSIERRNANRIARDRAGQQELTASLEAMRQKAADQIGPVAADKPAVKPVKLAMNPAPTATPGLNPAPANARDLQVPTGGAGAFDPLTAGLAAGLALLAIGGWKGKGGCGKA